MLKLCPDVASFHAPVFISVAGNPKPVRIEAEFKFMGRKALQEYFDGIADKKDVEALSEILLGWKGVEAEFSPKHLRNFWTRLTRLLVVPSSRPSARKF